MMIAVDSSSSSDALAMDSMLSLAAFPSSLANASTADTNVRPPTTRIVAQKVMVAVDSSSSSDALATDRMLSLVFFSTADANARPPTTGVV